MKHTIPLAGLALAFTLSGCTEAQFTEFFSPGSGTEGAVPASVDVPPETLDPTPPPPPPPTANTADEFDTTTAEDRAAALAVPEPAGEQSLGTTLATLGDPADPGIWMETPLVTELVMGRVEVTATGKTVVLELRPSGGEVGSGSEISLPAMRLLEIPLTAIQELAVFAG
ncbi:D-galactarate dehydratase [Flavimaricola marinus]|uniref:D-galactarate dehydratase n=1 Tax=Flavimaricola marinus TaxID=1819565 RepID=A0A238LFV6_9RHOB|nr:D-galactarate dehydratase [Flavimaricola marinus]SMY07770.1 hypothetical protein LOM8899_01910 [Flavimaricola marinus]